MFKRPIALLVGASSGLGAALAQAIAPHYHLVLVARTQARLEVLDDALRAQGHSATLVPVDLAEQHDHIDHIVAGLWQRFTRLDLLVGLAATTADASPLAHLAPPDFTRMMMVNCQAHYRFLRATDALLRQAPKGRALMVGGRLHNDYKAKHNPFTAGFDASKAALEQMTHNFCAELSHTNLKAGLVLPHPFDSRLRRIVYPGQSPEKLSSATQQAAYLTQHILNDDWNNGDKLMLPQ